MIPAVSPIHLFHRDVLLFCVRIPWPWGKDPENLRQLDAFDKAHLEMVMVMLTGAVLGVWP
jgi:hypothetical protein